MQIVAVTRVLNEEDIIEAMVRHHAALVDHHILLDNGSEDRTLEILAALKAEGLHLTVMQNESVVFSESQFNTFLYNTAVLFHAADWVLFLDADEFIDARRAGDLRAFLAALPDEQATVGVELINYDSTTAESQAELNPARRFVRRLPQPIDVWKVFVRGNLGVGRVTVDAGNHHIALGAEYQPPVKQADVLLAHFPNRSPFHWAGKAVTGRLRVLAAGQAELRQNRSFHYNQTVDRLKHDAGDWVRAATAGFEALKSAPHLVEDPIVYLGRDLIYTQPVDYGWRAVSLMLSTVEKMAARFGALLDDCPPARAYIDASIRETRTLFDGPAGAVAAPYGSIVTNAWRPALDPSFLALLGTGWSRPEKWGGVWGVGPQHELRISYLAVPDGDAEFEADVAAPLVGARERQSVDVVVLGETLATWEFTRAHNRAMRTVRVPRALIAASLPVLTLAFQPHEVAAPRDIDPGNKDDRPLGLGLRGLRQRTVPSG